MVSSCGSQRATSTAPQARILALNCLRGASRYWRAVELQIALENWVHPQSGDDGDSFILLSKESSFFIWWTRQTDALTPARLVEQAKYFEITVPQAIEVGEAAKEFTRQKLSQPFTVFTRMSDAMGRSKLKRFYAFVQTREGDLGEQLVRNGLARNYGYKAVPPGLKNSRAELEKLQQFEDEAKQEKIGGWGVDAGRLHMLKSQRLLMFS